MRFAWVEICKEIKYGLRGTVIILWNNKYTKVRYYGCLEIIDIEEDNMIKRVNLDIANILKDS